MAVCAVTRSLDYGDSSSGGRSGDDGSSKLTPSLAIESFRASFVLGDGNGDQEVDLDAILGELCALETQLNSQNSAISKNTPMQKDSPGAFVLPVSDPPPRASPPVETPGNKTNVDQTVPRLRQSTPESGGHSHTMERRMSALDDALEQMTQLGLNMVREDSDAADSGTGGGQHTSRMNESHQANRRSQASSSSSRSPRESYFRDQDRDSAFMENESIRSSESFLSVETTESNQSSSSSGGNLVCTSDYHSAESGMTVTTIDSNQMLGGYSAMSGQPMGSDETEQAAKLKAEKIRIAMEKMKESNFRKLFVRAFASDGSSKSILVDETMSIRKVWQILTDKNHFKPLVDFVVVEHLPALYMERILEDHDSIVDVMLMWTKETTNRILFVDRKDKYDVFKHPERYLLGNTYSEKGAAYDEPARNKLLEEFFSIHQIPEVEGMLYIKAEGKKAWKKIYCVLRASGIYCNPKGKSKASKDLTSLVQLDLVDVYTGVGWKKKYKSPTDFCFALKHPKIQKKACKYIKYLCAEDRHSYRQWVTGIRIAKHGKRLYDNYRSAIGDIQTWDTTVLPSIGKMASDRLSMLTVDTSASKRTERTEGRRGSLPSNAVHGVQQKPLQRRASVATHDSADRQRKISPKSMPGRSLSFAVRNNNSEDRNSVCGSSSTDSSESQGATITRQFDDNHNTMRKSFRGSRAKANLPVTTDVTKYLTQLRDTPSLQQVPMQQPLQHLTRDNTPPPPPPAEFRDDYAKFERSTPTPPPPPLSLEDYGLSNSGRNTPTFPPPPSEFSTMQTGRSTPTLPPPPAFDAPIYDTIPASKCRSASESHLDEVVQPNRRVPSPIPPPVPPVNSQPQPLYNIPVIKPTDKRHSPQREGARVFMPDDSPGDTASVGLPFVKELLNRSSQIHPDGTQTLAIRSQSPGRGREMPSFAKPPISPREHRRTVSHGGGMQKYPPYGTPHSVSDTQISSHGGQIYEDVNELCDIDSLPPPPPELLEGLASPKPNSKGKPPPPPPKRKDSILNKTS